MPARFVVRTPEECRQAKRHCTITAESGTKPRAWPLDLISPPGDTAGGTGYSTIVDGITLASTADELRLGGSLTLTEPARTGGGTVVCVHGDPTAAAGAPAGNKAALCVAASGPPRPVSYLSSGSAGQQTISFNRWGEPLHLTAPPNPIAASSIGTGTV
jgi:hypothetical protein